MRCSRLAAALGCALLACAGELERSSPHPTAVTPGTGYQLRDTQVRIRGDGFLVEPYQKANGAPRIDSSFRAWLGAAELADVRWVSEGELRARVPAGLPTGDYRLRIQDPRGATGDLDDAFTVVPGSPPVLAAAAALLPGVASLGQPVTLRVTVTNGGGVPAAAVALAATVTGDALALPSTMPPTVDLAPGATQVFQIDGTAAALGAAAVAVDVSVTDPATGVPVLAASAPPASLLVEPASLLTSAATAAPVQVSVGQLVKVNVAYSNAPDVAPVMGLQPTFSGTSGAGAVSLVDLPPPCDVPSGGACVATFVFEATGAGSLELYLDAAGTDANSGAPVAAPRATVTILVVDEAAKALDDPFGDGTTFAFVFAYDGHVFLGPSGDGRGLVRCLPDATGCASTALSFYRDGVSTGSVHQNPCPQYVTLGSTTPPGSPGYCDPDDPWATACNCGPNLEAGRGMFASMTIAGNEWLVAMGRSKKGFLRYLYMTRETVSPLAVSYVDLTASIPISPDPRVEDVTSLAVLSDRVYVGLQVQSPDGPRLVSLLRTPVAPGLDASAGDTAATTFQWTPMNETGNVISQVDSMLGFEGRLFVANRRAVLLSRTDTPDLSADASTQFDDCTPLDPATWLAGAFDYAGKIDVTPADKVVSGLTAWQGRLYLARNTLANVPEIWVFTPRHDPAGSFLGCAADRSDWKRIATTFGDPGNVRATALFASSAFLYVGYDDAASGVQLFRTSAPAPAAEGDFTGRQGCTAPCAPLGRAGFGDAANVRFLDARTMTFAGVDEVWATVGTTSGPVRVYRVAE